MKLSKAIELNKESEKSLRSHKFIDHANAALIGNEAIKRVLALRTPGRFTHLGILPGETEE